MSNTYTIVTTLPLCDYQSIPGSICHGAPEHHARVDGATQHGGPWAHMCEDAFRLYGVGVGVGLGQVLLLPNEPTPRSRFQWADVFGPNASPLL